MGDDAQLYDDAVKALAQFRSEYQGEAIASLAAELSHLIKPTMAFDSALQERDREFARVSKAFVDETKRIAKRGPAYQTPVFKCHGDYETCMKRNGGTICIILFTLCIAKQLLPFVNHPKK